MTSLLERQLAASVRENDGAALARPIHAALARDESELSVEAIIGQVRKVQEVMQAVMKEGEHYGVIPGTGGKPTLLKPGAEKLCLLFRLAPEYETTEQRDGNHLTVITRCRLRHIPTDQVRGSGLGSCSTRESKYAYRKAERQCPKCKAESIIKGKEQYGGGWLCWQKKGGCGAKFKSGDESIESQTATRAENPDIADVFNTVLKMSNKRALVAAVLTATAASDIFTQDLEDLPEAPVHHTSPPGNISPHVDPDEDPNAPSPKNSPFNAIMDELVQLEGQVDLVQSYDQTLAIRADFGSKAKPGARIPKTIQQAKEARSVSPAEYKSMSQIWQRIDRKLQKLEAQLTPSAEASFIDPDDDGRELID